MESVWTTLIWAVVTVMIAGALIHRFGQPIVDLIRAHQESVEANRLRQEAAALELQTEAEIGDRTLDERTRLRQAELLRKAAEIETETKAVEATATDRVEAEKRVLEARTQRRIQAAQEEPVNQPPSPDTMAALTSGYREYIKQVPHQVNFDEWLGSPEWTELDPGRAVSLIEAYKASCRTRAAITFSDWVGQMEFREGQLAFSED